MGKKFEKYVNPHSKPELGYSTKKTKISKKPKKEIFDTVNDVITKSNLGDLSKIDTCIFDPSMIPFLQEFENTKLKKIFIPDDFFKMERENELNKLIKLWSRARFDVKYIFEIFKEHKIGSAILVPIEEDYDSSAIQDDDERPSKSKKKKITKKIINFAHKSKQIIISRTKKLPEESKKLGLLILDLPNNMVRGKKKFFNEKTRGMAARSSGLRYIGGVTFAIVTGVVTINPIVGILAGLTFVIVDP